MFYNVQKNLFNCEDMVIRQKHALLVVTSTMYTITWFMYIINVHDLWTSSYFHKIYNNDKLILVDYNRYTSLPVTLCQ